MTGRRWWLAALCAVSTAVLAEDLNVDGVHRFYAYAYDLASGKYLYTETHEQVIEHGKWVRGRIDYWLPDGTAFGHKTLDFSSDPAIPLYRTELLRPHRIEGISQAGEQITMFVQQGDQAEKRTTVARQGLMTADSGFHNFLRAHFDELMAGKVIDFRFVAAPRQDTYKFRARRIEDQVINGKTGVQFLIEPNSLLSLIADPLHLVYDPATRMLLEFRGISNVLNPATGDEYNVRIDFLDKPPADAPARLPPLS